jgi:hypothetical protein
MPSERPIARLRHPATKGADDRGITVIFFALALTAMLGVSALVLGGSVGYEAARNAQTAADAAALAGTSALQNHKQDWITTPVEVVIDEVRSVAEDNGAELESCDVVAAGYALTGAEADVIAACDDLPHLVDEDFQAVAGIRVTVSDTRDVAFAAFVDQDEITSRAVAAATVQPVSRGWAPFMVCTSPTAVGHPAQAMLQDEDAPNGFSINSAAIGKHYVLWGNQIKNLGRDCGNGSSSWRGLVRLPADGYALPSSEATPGDDEDWWQVDTGNKTGQLSQRMAGGNACTFDAGDDVDDIELGCEIALPLCARGNGETGSNFRLYCVMMGVFQITHVGSATTVETEPPEETPCGSITNNIICGRFLGAATAAGGQGVAETPDRHGYAVIKLVQ